MRVDKPRILVVDDEKFNRSVLSDLLKPEYTVTLAKDGHQAIEKAHSEHPPELILLDVAMPVMDGYMACSELKASPITRDIPIIFVTAMQSQEDEHKGLQLGAIDYIAKPFSPPIVLARVRNHLALSQARQKLAEAHTMLAMKNKQLEVMATKDALTGLNNRYSLDEELTREMNKAKRFERPLSVMLIDIDNFKQINDNFGHQVGDMVLKQIGNQLQHGVRNTDIVGRWGGEEFLVVCPETDVEGVCKLAENLRTKVEEQVYPVQSNVTASFGVTSLEGDESIKELLNRADSNLYRAKESGRNKVVCGPKCSECGKDINAA